MIHGDFREALPLLSADAQRDDEIVTATLSSATDPATLIDQLSMQQTRMTSDHISASVRAVNLAGRHDALCQSRSR